SKIARNEPVATFFGRCEHGCILANIDNHRGEERDSTGNADASPGEGMDPAFRFAEMSGHREFQPQRRFALFARLCAASLLVVASSRASNLDIIGLTALRAVTTNLNGSGIRVTQPEAGNDANQPPAFEVDPSTVGVGGGLISY